MWPEGKQSITEVFFSFYLPHTVFVNIFNFLSLMIRNIMQKVFIKKDIFFFKTDLKEVLFVLKLWEVNI